MSIITKDIKTAKRVNRSSVSRETYISLRTFSAKRDNPNKKGGGRSGRLPEPSLPGQGVREPQVKHHTRVNRSHRHEVVWGEHLDEKCGGVLVRMHSVRDTGMATKGKDSFINIYIYIYIYLTRNKTAVSTLLSIRVAWSPNIIFFFI